MSSMTSDIQIGAEYWMRCPQCGDSQKNRNKAHWSVNLHTMKHYCFRCGYSGKMSTDQAFAIIGEFFFSPVTVDDTYSLEQRYHLLEWSKQPGAGTDRASALDRYYIETHSGPIDIFAAKDYGGEVVGYNCRPSWVKNAFTVGTRGLGYPGTKIPALVRIVEGPYDALYPEDVATFGLPSNYQWSLLRGCQLILCPDSDVWERPDLAFRYITAARRTGWIAHVEWLPAGKDPDDVPAKERECIPLSEAIRRLKKLAQGRERAMSRPSPVDVPLAWSRKVDESVVDSGAGE